MTRQTWTAFASAVVFIALAILLAAVPMPKPSGGPEKKRPMPGSAATSTV